MLKARKDWQSIGSSIFIVVIFIFHYKMFCRILSYYGVLFYPSQVSVRNVLPLIWGILKCDLEHTPETWLFISHGALCTYCLFEPMSSVYALGCSRPPKSDLGENPDNSEYSKLCCGPAASGSTRGNGSVNRPEIGWHRLPCLGLLRCVLSKPGWSWGDSSWETEFRYPVPM